MWLERRTSIFFGEMLELLWRGLDREIFQP